MSRCSVGPEPYFEEYQECQCCNGYVYSCGERSLPCGELGVCGCAYEDMEMHEIAHGLYNSSDTLLMEAEMSQQEADMDPTNDWYPESAGCDCCNGYRYACKNCTAARVCHCAGEGAKPLPSPVREEDEGWVAASAKCSCCKGYPYSCTNPQCVELQGCVCLYSEEQLLSRLKELVEYCHEIGRFPESSAEEERLPKDQRDFLTELRKDILIFVDTTAARVRTLATSLVDLVREYPDEAAHMVSYYKNRIGASAELRREAEWKNIFRDALMGKIFGECKDLLRPSPDDKVNGDLSKEKRAHILSSFFTIVFTRYPKKNIFTLLSPLIAEDINTELFYLACERISSVLKEYPEPWKQILEKLKSVKKEPEDAEFLTKLDALV